ncbi:hypothetical protein [Streptomyces xanthii]|uniref:Uncharacterized protein n=1 Tax=Streptomyces xanthii TaxID=2768069 RepID=A0A7H1B9L5_9ACTN|nr:hypothetical protein [Streptomyces xanthii]QNS05420.1 hypothetical protein IAG42_18670 [Streptomyces xanthii]
MLQENTQPAEPVRRSAKRVIGAVVLVLLGAGLLYVGIDAIADPASVVADSANTGRSADTEAEAKIVGLVMCLFGISVLGFGISLLRANATQGPKPGS